MPMTPAKIWETWAPADALWSQWAKPVMIAQLTDVGAIGGAPLEWQCLDVSALPTSSDRMALVVDLEGVLSISYGLALAKRGFRPVPLFNGCVGWPAVVPTQQVQAALVEGAKELREMELDADAPPAFLLDAQRLKDTGRVKPGQFDNRWMTFPQDFPSGALLQSRLLEMAILLQDDDEISEDLTHVLLRWQESGVRISRQNRGPQSMPLPITIRRPAGYRALWQRALAALGLRRNSAGGFGSVIPEPAPEGGYSGFG